MADPLEMLYNIIPPQQVAAWSWQLTAVGIGCFLIFLAITFREKIIHNPFIRRVILSRQYTVKIRLYESREGGIYTEDDWAKPISEKDDKGQTIEYYDLLNMDAYAPIPELKHLQNGPGGIVVCHLFLPSRRVFQPMTIIYKSREQKILPCVPIGTITDKVLTPNELEEIDIKLQPVLDEKMKLIYRHLTEKQFRIMPQQQEIWEKLLPILMVGTVAVSTTIIIFAASARLETIAQAFTAMVAPLQEIAKNMPAVIRPPV